MPHESTRLSIKGMEKTLSQLYGLSRKRFADEALRLGLSAEEWRDIELKIITLQIQSHAILYRRTGCSFFFGIGS